MKVVLFGSSGFLGSRVKLLLRGEDHELILPGRESFNQASDQFGSAFIENQDIVMNFTGAPIGRRWNESYKKEIYDSRILTTRKIAEAIQKAKHPPRLFLNASAVGIYADGPKQNEESRNYVSTFIGKLIRDWESEALQTEKICRTVVLRLGLVLAKNEGALEKMAPPFKSGIGARIGNGEQGVSWIHIDDLVEIIRFIIHREEISGIVNATGEYPTDNYYFSEMLGKVFGQPVYFFIPRFVLKVAFGEGAQILTDGQKVIPGKLLQNGYAFQYPSIDKALVAIYKD